MPLPPSKQISSDDFNALLNRHRGLIEARCRTAASPEDAFQDIMLAALQGRPSFNAELREPPDLNILFGGWLQRIADHVLGEHAVEAAEERRYRTEFNAQVGGLCSKEVSPPDAASSNEWQSLLREALKGAIEALRASLSEESAASSKSRRALTALDAMFPPGAPLSVSPLLNGVGWRAHEVATALGGVSRESARITAQVVLSRLRAELSRRLPSKEY